MAGSLPTSYVWNVPGVPWMVLLFGLLAFGPMNSGALRRWRKGGSMSPQLEPLFVDQSMPHWLKPTRESF